jgi:hypothetical protein
MTKKKKTPKASNAKKTSKASNAKKTPTKMYRQGDVLIVAVADLPASSVVPRTTRGIVLAEGEVTGHAHRIPSRSAQLFRTEESARYLRVKGPAPVQLEHEEHATVTIPPGVYRISIHAEYQPGALPRNVAD